MRPHYSPARYLLATSLVLGLWAMIPVGAFLAGRLVFLALFTDALVPAAEPAVVTVALPSNPTATTLAA